MVHTHAHDTPHLQCYRDSLELFNAALSLLTSKTTAVSAKVRQSLEDWLQEQVLVVQLLAANRELVTGGGATLKQRCDLTLKSYILYIHVSQLLHS